MQITGNPMAAQRALNNLMKISQRALIESTVKASVLQQTIWVEGIVEGKFKLKELSTITKVAKQSSKPLIDHGNMVRAIKRHKINPLAYFIGIHANAKSKDGKKMIDIASLHEYGGVIHMKSKLLAIPATRKASRAGSPLNYPGKLTFVKARGKNKHVVGVFLSDERSKEKTQGKARNSRVAYLLMTEVTIPARPHCKLAYEAFLKQAPKELGNAFVASMSHGLDQVA